MMLVRVPVFGMIIQRQLRKEAGSFGAEIFVDVVSVADRILDNP
ncbi:hypothetical protein [Endozoicomonas numazuensis]|nr:hypothetical protein [Endozoicomonas numazuensis]